MKDSDDREFLQSISKDVMAVLANHRYFERLDDLFSPQDGSEAVKCGHGFEHTHSILVQLGFDEQDREEVLGVLGVHGGCCDCEVLYNVAPVSRLREKYWKAKD